jgi:ribosomal protein S18 acetylase RimI-like enzyme
LKGDHGALENLRIRRLQKDDAEEVERIYAAITRKPETADFKRVLADQVDREDSACFAAEIDGKLVGFMISTILTAGFGMTKSAWIPTLGVSPDHMGHGIGAALAEEIFAFYRSRGIENVYTSVRWDSTDLLSFFKTLGFDRSNFINLLKVLK